MARVARRSDLVLHLDQGVDGVAPRIAHALVSAIADGRLTECDVVPPSRTLATTLGVSRSAVVAGFEELVACGFLEATPGGSTRVAPGAGPAARAGVFARPVDPPSRESVPERHSGAPIEFNLLPGRSDVSLLNRRDWRAAWRTATNASLDPQLIRPDTGVRSSVTDERLRRLRIQVVDHVRKYRGIVADAAADQVFVFPSVCGAVADIADVVVPKGKTIAFEDPGYAKARQALRMRGHRVRSVPVDRDGICTDELSGDDAAVYVTPAHQYPLGGRMSADRRRRLSEWTVDSKAIIFEDDYDGEFRYDVPPTTALRGMRDMADHIVYLGTTSKIINPDLRLTWAIVPPFVADELRRRHTADIDTVGALSIDFVAEFLASGAVARHLASASRTYAARRNRFTDACHRHLPGVDVMGIDAGLHVVLSLDHAQADDVALVHLLRRRGVACAALSTTYEDFARRRSGLICGYALLPETKSDAAAALIAEAVLDHRS